MYRFLTERPVKILIFGSTEKNDLLVGAVYLSDPKALFQITIFFLQVTLGDSVFEKVSTSYVCMFIYWVIVLTNCFFLMF